MRDTWQKWDVQANLHLLKHIRCHPKRYAPDCEGYPVVAGPETRRRTARLVAGKNAWAEDMRATNPVPADGGRAWWDDIIRRCDEDLGLLEDRAGRP